MNAITRKLAALMPGQHAPAPDDAPNHGAPAADRRHVGAPLQGLAGMARSLKPGAGTATNSKRPLGELPGPTLSVKHRISAGLSRLTHSHDRLLQPIVGINAMRNGREKIHFGKRSFFSGTVTLEAEGQPPRNVRVIAERHFHDDGSRLRQAFYPLDKNLKPDTSTRLYKRTDGRWGIDSLKDERDPSTRWLPADAFDKIARDGFKTGFHRVGNREFCVASTMQDSKSSNPSKPVMFECIRGATPAEDRYHAVKSNLGRGHAVYLPVDMAAADPFIGQITVQLESRLAGRVSLAGAGAQPLAIARAAAVSAFRAGAPVHEAIALGVDLVSVRGRVTDEHSLSTYAAAGSAAGLLHRSGATPEAASEAARSLIRMAEIMPSGQVATAAVDPLGLPAGPQRRHGILNLAYRDAAAGLGAMKTRVDRMDRSAHGADLSALTAAARQLFVEKGYTAAELPAIAAEKARQQRAKLDDRADQAEAAADEAHLAVLAASAELAKLEPTLPRSGGWSAASLLAPLRGGGAQAANPNAPALTLARATLDRAQQRHALASQGAAAARHDADQAGGEHGERLELAVSVLCAAHRAAPDNQHAAMVAARVACETFRAPGDAPRARFAADTAHLALLAGAPESDAIAIAHLAAESHDAAAPAGYSADDLRALQVAHVQVASPGGATPLDEAGSRARALAATAAVDLLAQANPDHQTASRLMGSLVSGTRPAPERPATAPLFLHADATAAKSPAPSLPAIPEHYEPVASTLSSEHAPLVKDWGHAKIREVRNHGFHAADGNAKTTYLIEMPGPKGKVWTEFSWSPNSNQLYGEIDVKPRNARDGEQAGHGKVLVAYNGTTGEWESFEKRTRDLKEKTLGVLDDMAALLESRDVGTGDWELPYSSSQSGFMQNVKHPYQTQIEEEIRLFVQGRHSQPQFKTRMSDLFIKMSKDLEGDRSRKKAIMRHQIDTALRLFSAAAGASLGSARVAASFS